MLNSVYRLVAPRRIEVEFNEISLDENTVIVRPAYLSICNADQRYFQGKRAAEVFAKKLPMALIHEGIGEVVYDGKGQFHPGDMVVMIPNTPVENDPVIEENYLRSSKFRASGFDGFMQDLVGLERSRVLSLPERMDPHVAAFTEFVSVGVHALSRFSRFTNPNKKEIAIWGDGNLGYVVGVLVKIKYPDTKLYVVGLNRDKLENFTFATQCFLANELPENFSFDHAFECVGSMGSEAAINQIIDHIRPEGTVSLLGVSENYPAVNTRMILEKGLRLFGSSRSGRKDFLETIRLYEEHPEMISFFETLVGAVVEINKIEDINKAFEIDIQKPGGKTILKWMI